MALQLKVNAIDRSSSIKWDTLTKTEGLTKQPDTLSFAILKTPSKTIPSLGDTIELFEDSIKIFSGILAERSEQVEGGLLQGYFLNCKDHTHTLDRKLAVKNYTSQTARAIVLDLIATFASGFTTTNVPLSTPIIPSIKFNYEPLSKALEKLATLIGWDWYVDYDKDIHFFQSSTQAAPFNLDDTSGNFEWQTLRFDRNILELKNSIFVRGGEYKTTISEANAVDKYIADGTQRVFTQIYRYTNIAVKKNSTTLTVGIDNITDPATKDILYNFQEKAIKFRDDNKPANGDTIKIYGDAHIPLIAKVQDSASIAAYGEYQHLIVNKTITSVLEAHAYAKAELAKWAEGAYEASLRTTRTGLSTGQQITINSTLRGITKTFKINRITGKARGSDHMEYDIYLLASGETTFTDMLEALLAKDRENIDVSDNEVLQRLESLADTVALGETLTPTKDSPPYKWGAGSSNDWRWNFATWS